MSETFINFYVSDQQDFEGSPSGFSGTREQKQFCNGNAGHGKKIVGNMGTSNAPRNTGTGTKTMIVSWIRVFSDLPNFCLTRIAPVFHVLSSTADQRSSKAVVCKPVPVSQGFRPPPPSLGARSLVVWPSPGRDP